eukprot:766064-Hanusia_phi.AAC.7
MKVLTWYLLLVPSNNTEADLFCKSGGSDIAQAVDRNGCDRNGGMPLMARGLEGEAVGLGVAGRVQEHLQVGEYGCSGSQGGEQHYHSISPG